MVIIMVVVMAHGHAAVQLVGGVVVQEEQRAMAMAMARVGVRQRGWEPCWRRCRQQQRHAEARMQRAAARVLHGCHVIHTPMRCGTNAAAWRPLTIMPMRVRVHLPRMAWPQRRCCCQHGDAQREATHVLQPGGQQAIRQ